MYKNKRILFVVPYPEGEAPSQRFRFEQYFTILTENGYDYDVASFLDKNTWKILYQKGNKFKKIAGVSKGFLNRCVLLSSLKRYDFVFIHREASPIGPPFFEWLSSKVLKKKIVYDFDDAIWLPNISSSNKLAAGIKFHSKVKEVCKWSHKVSCGNQYLANYALQYNKNVILNPTTIDTVHGHNKVKDQNTEKIVIGWTGTHSTLKYLLSLENVLQQLEQEFSNIDIQVIANQAPKLNLNKMRFIPWNKTSEIDDLLKFNIGIMPLTDDIWAKGKCGFKALQYMALGIPPVASPVGVNSTIIQQGKNGYLANTEEEWLTYLRELVTNCNKRMVLGTAAKETVLHHYSVVANTGNFLSLFA